MPKPKDTPTAYGYCRCGCGGKTNLARRTETKRGRVKGEPLAFIAGHHKRKPPLPPQWDESLGCYRIPISSSKYKGLFALVDAEDKDLVSGYRWYVRKNDRIFYAYGQTYTENGKRSVFPMHRLILGNPDRGWDVDHINHDGLDNRRENLRLVSHQQNAMNQRGWRKSSSQYKGVTRSRDSGRWIAKMNTNGDHIYLGVFDTEVDAARAYDQKAREVFGEHGYLNFPE